MLSKEELITLCNGNPGAATVVRELQWFTKWHEMCGWLIKNDYIGGKLWGLYKDKFHQSVYDLGHWIEKEMYKDEEFEHLEPNWYIKNLLKYK